MVGIGGAGLILTLITAASRQPMPINRRILEYGLASGFLLATPMPWASWRCGTWAPAFCR